MMKLSCLLLVVALTTTSGQNSCTESEPVERGTGLLEQLDNLGSVNEVGFDSIMTILNTQINEPDALLGQGQALLASAAEVGRLAASNTEMSTALLKPTMSSIMFQNCEHEDGKNKCESGKPVMVSAYVRNLDAAAAAKEYKCIAKYGDVTLTGNVVATLRAIPGAVTFGIDAGIYKMTCSVPGAVKSQIKEATFEAEFFMISTDGSDIMVKTSGPKIHYVNAAPSFRLGSSKINQCAREGQRCDCPGGEVRFGEFDAATSNLAGRMTAWKNVPASGNIMCTNGVFGDPAPGRGKYCECKRCSEEWGECEGGTVSMSFADLDSDRTSEAGVFKTIVVSDVHTNDDKLKVVAEFSKDGVVGFANSIVSTADDKECPDSYTRKGSMCYREGRKTSDFYGTGGASKNSKDCSRNCENIELKCKGEGGRLATKDEYHEFLDAGGSQGGKQYGVTSNKRGLDYWHTNNKGDYGYTNGCCHHTNRYFVCAAEPKAAGVAHTQVDLKATFSAESLGIPAGDTVETTVKLMVEDNYGTKSAPLEFKIVGEQVTAAPTAAPTVATNGHCVMKGNPDRTGVKQNLVCAKDDKRYRNRCCRVGRKGGTGNYADFTTRQGSCTTANLYSESQCHSVLKSQYGANNNYELVYARGEKACEAAGGRLCTLKEVAYECTSGSGCGYDGTRIWTSTPCVAGDVSMCKW